MGSNASSKAAGRELPSLFFFKSYLSVVLLFCFVIRFVDHQL